MNKIEGTKFKNNFLTDEQLLSLTELLQNIEYDNSMHSRLTYSFGKVYRYSGPNYKENKMPDILLDICDLISKELNFMPNNCLINVYRDGNDSMGYHSDDTSILEKNTGVAILSIGETRCIRFKSKNVDNTIKEYILKNNTFFYMNDDVQTKYKHAIPKSDTLNVRYSLTFRKLKMTITEAEELADFYQVELGSILDDNFDFIQPVYPIHGLFHTQLCKEDYDAVVKFGKIIKNYKRMNNLLKKF